MILPVRAMPFLDPEDPLRAEEELLRAKVTLETAAIAWRELLPHFARGAVVVVAPGLDLVEVALSFSRDDAGRIRQWMGEGRVNKVSDAQAQAWLDADAVVWSVVIMPWVLVQERVAH